MSVLPKGGGLSGPRWIVLILAAIAGFVGRGELMAGPATMVRYLIALFVAVFLFALAYSALSAPAPSEFLTDSGGERNPLPESQPVTHEAVLESP